MNKTRERQILVQTIDANGRVVKERRYANLDHLFYSLRQYQAKGLMARLEKLGISLGNHAKPYQDWNSSVEIPKFTPKDYLTESQKRAQMEAMYAELVARGEIKKE